MNPATGIYYFIFLAMFVLSLIVFYFRIRCKWLALRMVAPENRFNNWVERFKKMLLFAIGQKRILTDPSTGLMHAFIFWGFSILFIHTSSLYVGTIIPALNYERALGRFYAVPKDLFILLVTVAILYAAFRRAILRPKRIDPSFEAYLVLFLIFILMATDILSEASLHSMKIETYGFLGSWLAPLFNSWSKSALSTLFTACWWIQAGTILFFLNLLPGSKHFHVITALPNVFFQSLDHPGHLKPLDLEDEDAETFGVSRVEELNWKVLLDVYSCTECGRCHEFCPTNVTSKPLSPKRMNDHIKHFVYKHEKEIALGKTDKLPDLFEAEVVAPDEIWACTTCRYCEQACPLFIEEVQWIVDFRRYKTLMESDFPEELTKAFKGLENNSNPWGIGAHKRSEWAKDINVPLVDEVDDFEYLFFVGCAGSFDDRNKKVATAFAKLLKMAGVSFAILGEAEGCCGDPARRTGNEYLFQMLAQANIETFNKAGVKKIVTICPHGYNMLKNEYPDFGGRYEVLHHTELLNDLIKNGRLRPKHPLNSEIAFHDSCYLGRYNNIYDQPRSILASIDGVKVKELELHHEKSFCCGGGGGRVFMEESLGTRINHTRIEHVQNSGCSTVSAACPFCITMLGDGINEKGIENVEVKDVAEILLEAMEE